MEFLWRGQYTWPLPIYRGGQCRGNFGNWKCCQGSSFIGRMCTGALAIGVHVLRMLGLGSRRYWWCDLHLETDRHVLRDCSFAQLVWSFVGLDVEWVGRCKGDDVQHPPWAPKCQGLWAPLHDFPMSCKALGCPASTEWCLKQAPTEVAVYTE